VWTNSRYGDPKLIFMIIRPPFKYIVVRKKGLLLQSDKPFFPATFVLAVNLDENFLLAYQDGQKLVWSRCNITANFRNGIFYLSCSVTVKRGTLP